MFNTLKAWATLATQRTSIWVGCEVIVDSKFESRVWKRGSNLIGFKSDLNFDKRLNAVAWFMESKVFAVVLM